MVRVELYTDGRDEKTASENEKIENDLFHTSAQPFYALMDGDGKVLAQFPAGLTRDTQTFLARARSLDNASREQ